MQTRRHHSPIVLGRRVIILVLGCRVIIHVLGCCVVIHVTDGAALELDDV
jgi:hypothetical protein